VRAFGGGQRVWWKTVILRTLAMLVAGALGWVAWLAIQISGWTPPVRFDEQVWRAGASVPFGERSPRWAMIGDLRRNHLRPGTPRERVRALLGPSECDSQADREQRTDCWELGHVGAFGIDPTVLEVTYDKDGRLLRVEVYES
jgi:hypothetical protein